MKRLLTLLVLMLSLGLWAQAAPYTLKIDGRSTSIDGVQDGGQLYVPLLAYLQALGDGVRPVAFDYAANSIQLTRGDGSKKVNVSFKLIGNMPYVPALTAATGLGFQASVSGTTLSVGSQAAPVTPAQTVAQTSAQGAPIQAGSLYPRGFSAQEFETVARLLVDEMNSTSASTAMLQAVLNGSGLPVFGTQSRPADGDLLQIYQALHHPFSITPELFTLRTGFQFRLFTPINAYLSGLNDRGLTGSVLSAQTLPGLVSGKLFGGDPSRSQVVLALVGAIGRERMRRGISVSHRPDPFWGDDALDPVQLRLLSAVLETGSGPEKLLARRGWLPPGLVWTRLFSFQQAAPALTLAEYHPAQNLYAQAAGADTFVPKSASDFFGKVADKAVKEGVKEVYPEAKDWLDNSVQDALGIPIALPVSSELLEGVAKGDTEKVKSTWTGLIKSAIVDTAKEGARTIICGSVVLYGYQSKVSADRNPIHHRTDGDEAGPSLSKLTVNLSYAGDYRDQVFKAPVRYASSLGPGKPLTTVGELLDRLGCELPKDDPKTGENPVKGKGVEWEVTGDIENHLNGGKPDFADPSTDMGGVAHAQFRAIDEQTPKAFRTEAAAASGNIFVRFKNLLPQKWWLVQAAAQFGQGTSDDTSDQGKAGSSTQRLEIKYYQPPKLTLKFHSTLTGTSGDSNFNFQLDASVPLEAKWSGTPGDPLARFLGYEGVGTLHYEAYSLKAKCGSKISGVHDGKLEVRVLAENFASPQLTVVVNPGFSQNSVYPREDVVVTSPDCIGASTIGLWFGSWLGVYGTDQNKLVGTLPGQSFGGVILREPRQSGTSLFQKTIGGRANAFGAEVTDSTQIRLDITP